MFWLFDIDGTLIRSGGAGSLAMSRALASCFDVQPDMAGVPFAGRTDREITQNLFAAHGIGWSNDAVRRFHECYLTLLPQALAECRGEVLQGAQLWLDCLEAHPRAQLGILTGNMQASAAIKLQHYGLWDRFGFGGYGDRHCNRDDVAEAAVHEARSTHPHLEGSSVWVVGDTPRDIRCARSQGARVIAVATGGYTTHELEAHRPDVTLQDLSQIHVLHEILAEDNGAA